MQATGADDREVMRSAWVYRSGPETTHLSSSPETQGDGNEAEAFLKVAAVFSAMPGADLAFSPVPAREAEPPAPWVELSGSPARAVVE